MTNLFGDIPYINTTNVEDNAIVSRASQNLIYDLITQDLIEAQSLMEEGFSFSPGEERIRANKAAATAMLARIYLYNEDWLNAENQSSNLIEQTNLYLLEDSLRNVFPATSREAIFQLKERQAGIVNQGLFFNLVLPPNDYSPNAFTSNFISSVEPNDKRLGTWIGVADFGTVYYYPNKYTASFVATPDQPEYIVVLRLAEQYLIRSEARANQGNLAGAIADLDVIRNRAGLLLLANTNPGIAQANLLLAIEQERRVEFCAEWGHRWFDLKRTGRANNVLSQVKDDWQSTDVLFPIPEREILNNPNLLPQNPGY